MKQTNLNIYRDPVIGLGNKKNVSGRLLPSFYVGRIWIDMYVKIHW